MTSGLFVPRSTGRSSSGQADSDDRTSGERDNPSSRAPRAASSDRAAKATDKAPYGQQGLDLPTAPYSHTPDRRAGGSRWLDLPVRLSGLFLRYEDPDAAALVDTYVSATVG